MNIKPSNGLEKKLSLFTEDQKELMFKNTHSIQLTEGCSIGCTDCGFDAKKGVRDYIPFDFLDELFSKYGSDLGKVDTLYYASEPFDYQDGKKGYLDVHSLFEEKVYQKFGIVVSTSIPKGKEKEIFDLLISGKKRIFGDGRIINRISLTKFNYKRIEEVFKKQNNPKISEISFKDFTSHIGNGYIEVFDFYKRKNAKRVKLGEKNLQKLDEEGIGSSHGVLITPVDIFNLQTLKPSKEHPYGQIITPIDPDNFEIIPYGT